MVHTAHEMTKRRFFVGAGFFWCLFSPWVCAADPAREDATLEPEAEFAVRTGQAEYSSPEDLIEKPRKLQLNVTSWDHNGHYVIRAESDIDCIYPLPVRDFVEVLLDYEHTKEYYPRVVESELKHTSEDPYGKHTLLVHISIEVLGIGENYYYATNNWMERHNRGFVQKFNLADSPDGRFYQMLGNWYLEELEIRGRKHTYVRQYSILGIRRGSGAMEVAIKAFGTLNLKFLFKNLYHAAKNHGSSPD